MSVLGLDIGGANIKAADGLGFAQSYPFALWREAEKLADKLREISRTAPDSDRVVATMTGELADCYDSKRHGVHAIIDALVEAVADHQIQVYLIGGDLVAPAEGKQRYLEAAAANWHALARFALRYTEGIASLLIDLGSTTCDVIPLVHNRVAATGTTDTERLLQSELIYMGVERTPVSTIVDSLPYRGRTCPIARELFATTLDVYVTLGDLAEDEANCDTADGRPSVRSCARARLARCICGDDEQFTDADAVVAARAVASRQADELATAIQRIGLRIGEPSPRLVVSGHGDFLLRRAVRRGGIQGQVMSLAQDVGIEVARCASAHALAVLAQEK